MPRTPVIIELTPTRLSAAIATRAGVERLQSTALDQSKWTHAWDHGLRSLDAPLTALLDSIGVRSARAALLYTSPSAAMDVVGAPGRRSGAREAARLALAEAACFDLLSNPACVIDLGDDASGDPPLHHALGAADRAEAPATLIDWLERCGVQAQRVLPGEAAAIVDVATRAFANATRAPEAWVRIGEHATSLAVGVEGRLLLVRTIEVGLSAIADPLTRLFAGADREEPPRRAALRFLFEHGVPDARDIIDAQRAIHGADVLPVIQPVLQRLFVEIKQSLRFGLSREDHQAVSLQVTGPGALVPRLADLLAEHTERFVGVAAPALAQPAAEAPENACALPADVAPPYPDLNLVPQARLEATAVRATRRALIGGGVAAALLIGAETMTHLRAATDAERQLQSMQASLRQASHLETTRERLGAYRAALRTTEASIGERLGRRTAWSAWLRDATRRIPEGVRFTHVHAGAQGGEPIVTLRGHAREGEGADASRTISAFARALEASPLTTQVTLGATQRVRTPSGDARQFEITVSLLGVPVGLLTEGGTE